MIERKSASELCKISSQVIVSIGLSWLFCHILTVTDVLPNNSTLPAYQARTDARIGVLERAKWFYWPYPCE